MTNSLIGSICSSELSRRSITESIQESWWSMDNFISTFLNNPESIGFPVLFVFLLVWVMKQNNAREERYLNTIDGLTEALKQVERIETTVNHINERIGDQG